MKPGYTDYLKALTGKRGSLAQRISEAVETSKNVRIIRESLSVASRVGSVCIRNSMSLKGTIYERLSLENHSIEDLNRLSRTISIKDSKD